MVNILTNLIVCFILFLAIIFFMQLLKKLKHFDTTSEKISPFLKTVLKAAETMSKNIEKLDRLSQENKRAIQEHIPGAQHLRDDFDVLITISEKLALRLEDSIVKARKAESDLSLVLQKIENAKNSKNVELETLRQDAYTVNSSRIKTEEEELNRGTVKKIISGVQQNIHEDIVNDVPQQSFQFIKNKNIHHSDLLEVIKQLR
ncbi:MAG: hypothetical protein C0432_00965 [Candidatus Puniceispirillum sp.]|nr:hypothetical protein [Candidatus Pelagibacter sp.]MBA4282853.1 hypothetical protein [Candidatus Puniceispirillum sp.]